ncbi:hypothetical protein ACJJTC_001142 [Scirpophaga incertulas]
MVWVKARMVLPARRGAAGCTSPCSWAAPSETDVSGRPRTSESALNCSICARPIRCLRSFFKNPMRSIARHVRKLERESMFVSRDPRPKVSMASAIRTSALFPADKVAFLLTGSTSQSRRPTQRCTSHYQLRLSEGLTRAYEFRVMFVPGSLPRWAAPLCPPAI